MTVSSNADDPWPEVLVEWLGSSQLRFVDYHCKRFGVIKRSGNSLVVTNLKYDHVHFHEGLKVKPDFKAVS
jgi:hypothetical protein